METALIALVVCAVLVLNGRATMVIVRDASSERYKKVWQLMLVWLLPILGATLTLAVHGPTEKPSHRYRRTPDPGDDFAYSGRSQKSLSEAIDGE
jgi:hypothetical protein